MAASSHHQDSNNNNNGGGGEWISLNVGGKLFTTTRTTLCTNEPNSMLARMFSQHELYLPQSQEADNQNTAAAGTAGLNYSYGLRPSPRDAQGAYLIDRSPKYFEPILNYLRHGKLILDHDVNVQGVLEEAKFYGIVSLLPMLELETERWFKKRHHDLIQSQLEYSNNLAELALQHQQQLRWGLLGDSSRPASNTNATSNLQNLGSQLTNSSSNNLNQPLGRQDVIRALMGTSGQTRELRFQGCNLAGANLSKLDLRHINFKYANMRQCDLRGANLSQANLERVDLSRASLVGCQINGANFAHANLEESNLRAMTSVHNCCSLSAGQGVLLMGNNNNNNNNSSNNNNNNNNHHELQNGASFTAASQHHLAQFGAANFESAQLRNSRLDGSQLVDVNFRRAVLRNASLQNCDLTRANLYGADLEGCDLSGSDLSEANWRRANLKEAHYEPEVM